ncbi:MAG: PepSY domain-containing protein [Janthinobacterium lividum]
MARPFLFIAVALAMAGGAPAVAQREQDNAYRLARDGQIMELGTILRQVSPQVGGKFIGSEFDADRAMYRLRYMQAGTVRNVDVDARTGRIVGGGAF